MKQSRFNAGLIAIATLPLTMSSAFALDLSVQPRATLGYQYYEFDVPNSQNADIEVDYLLGGLGMTGQVGRFFVDLYGQTNLTEADYEDESAVANVDREATVDRTEINLTAGVTVIPQLTLFGGLKYAQNKIEIDFFSNDANIDAVIGNDFFDIDVEYFGPFGGLAASLPVSNIGALSLNGSVAYLDGETTVNAAAAGQVIASDVEIDGKALGYNVGLNWTGWLGFLSPSLSNVGYGLGVEYSTYEFEDDDVEEFNEKTVRGRFDLKYRL